MIQRLCERILFERGRKRVPTSFAPRSATASMSCGRFACTMHVTQPAAPASCAALSFVKMPPVPHWLPELEPAASTVRIAAATSATSRIGAAGASPGAGGLVGLLVYNASTSVARKSQPAPTMVATSAERVSLSPNLSSEIATESFSFTTGTTPSLRSWTNVACALRYPVLEPSASADRSTWAMGWPRAEKRLS